ncbi:hypothetical protein C4J97_1555 [Pseudomonas orientalis]|nr:hypothetical protein C4J97_1555 [Pseudomonas orientalis]
MTDPTPINHHATPRSILPARCHQNSSWQLCRGYGRQTPDH